MRLYMVFKQHPNAACLRGVYLWHVFGAVYAGSARAACEDAAIADDRSGRFAAVAVEEFAAGVALLEDPAAEASP